MRYEQIEKIVDEITQNLYARLRDEIHKEIEKVYVPDSVTKICAEAFRNCDSLYELDGGKNLKTVIKGAFYGTKIDEQ